LAPRLIANEPAIGQCSMRTASEIGWDESMRLPLWREIANPLKPLCATTTAEPPRIGRIAASRGVGYKRREIYQQEQ
jgi:hypothetical protein